MVNYTVYEDERKLIVELTYPKGSSIDFQFLSENNFSEIEILYPEEKLLAKFEKTQNLDRALNQGVIAGGRHYPLTRVHVEQLIKDYFQKSEKRSSKNEILQHSESKEVFIPISPEKIYQKPTREEELELRRVDEKNLWIDRETGEVVDKTTGEVLGYELNREPEWRAYDLGQMEKRARVGPPATFFVHDKFLHTSIDWRDTDIFGRSLKPEQKYEFERLRRWQNRMRISKSTERTLAYGLSEICRKTELLNLPKSVKETACLILGRVVKDGKTRGRNSNAVKAACVYLACRQCNFPITLYKIAKAFNLTKKKVGKTYMRLRKKLNYDADVQEPSNFVNTLASRLSLSSKAEEIAIKAVKAAKGYKLTSGKNPLSIAAAATYIGSRLTGEGTTQAEIANEARITEVTLRDRYHELWENLLFEIRI